MTLLQPRFDSSALANPERKGDGWAFAGKGLNNLNDDRMALPKVPSFSLAIGDSGDVSNQLTRLVNAPRASEDTQIPIAHSLTRHLG